jgi:hypothetical protein
MPSPPSAVQRETNILPVDPVALVDPVDPVVPVYLVASINMPRDITIGYKMPAWARQTL